MRSSASGLANIRLYLLILTSSMSTKLLFRPTHIAATCFCCSVVTWSCISKIRGVTTTETVSRMSSSLLKPFSFYPVATYGAISKHKLLPELAGELRNTLSSSICFHCFVSGASQLLISKLGLTIFNCLFKKAHVDISTQFSTQCLLFSHCLQDCIFS